MLHKLDTRSATNQNSGHSIIRCQESRPVSKSGRIRGTHERRTLAPLTPPFPYSRQVISPNFFLLHHLLVKMILAEKKAKS